MSFQVNIPPSVMAKMAKSAEGEEDIADREENTRKKREDWKKLKELEEMRKAGTAPAMQDEEGKDINPHIPQYIMQAPWYFGTTAPTLNHQRTQPEKEKTFASPEQWYKRGVKEGPIATKFRKGACGNCGAMTHKQKDCLERPRKVGAKFTGSEIAPDEFIQPQLSHDFDGKRDRWNGYDTDEHKRIIEEFQKVEEAKKLLKAQKLESSIDTGEEEKQEVLGDVDGDDEDKYADDVEMPGQRMDTKQRITVRNLRIREDTAKYLYNLELNSAHYDPKTRSMRENPFEKLGKEEKELPFAGDNFVRYSGDAHQMSKRQMFAWQAYEKGTDTHLQADPTKLEMLATEYKKRKENYKSNMKNSILEKYGGEEHLEAPAKELLLAQTEHYVEYSRHGTVIKGQEKAKIKSCYEEDVYISNHTSVWGSYWNAGQWGFHCCHSLIKESYCTGTAGRAAQQTIIPALAQETEEPPKSLVEQHQAKMAQESKKGKKKKDKKKKKRRSKTKKRKKVESSSESSSDTSSSSESEDEDAKREKRIKKAMKVEEERIQRVNKILEMDERKRPYNSMYNEAAPTEEEVEAFRRKQHHPDDPMAQFLK